MYFEIENTPEHIRRLRKTEAVKKATPIEEIPRLKLAPFSRPPQIVFDNVLVGTTSERNFEVFNPSKHPQQITLEQSLPEGLVIHLPNDYLTVEPETCYCMTILWTPRQPVALRETIHFINDNRKRFDILVVLKSALNVKNKSRAGFRVSPGKIKKKQSKRSPVALYKKKAEVIYNTTQIKKTVNIQQTSVQHTYRKYDKENNPPMQNDYSNQMDYMTRKCPFGSPNSIDFTFNTSEIFSTMRKDKTEALQQTYEKNFASNDNSPVNILKESNRQCFKYKEPNADIFDNLTFTPLKSAPVQHEKLVQGPKIILSMNSDSDFEDSLDANKENAQHSIMCVTSSAPPNRWLTVEQQKHYHEHNFIETPAIQSKKIPNTSSPKELNSPNFSINTDFSRISDLSFLPQRVSTEKKMIPPKLNNDTHEILEEFNLKMCSDTFTKDSPHQVLTSLENHYNPFHIESKLPPYFQQPKLCRQSLFREYQQQREMSEVKNYVKIPVYETDVWQNQLRVDTKSPPPRSLTPPLQSIPEESVQFSDTQVLDKTDKQMTTFTINKTFDKIAERPSLSARQSWSKKSVKGEPELWKVPVAQPRKSLKPKAVKRDEVSKINNTTFESNKTQNISLNFISNVYSQSLTVDPFMSSTYFYDEDAVDKFETEFKRWLNYILTPPADLDSNVEQKIDVGKAWLEHRNKEIPAAPTKEQVCSKYHNSHRLESLRRSARALLMSADIANVIQKLNAQIEKKLIAIRADKNLHLDVGLQKIIMEILLSYNPLWLRIGLEAIYGLVLPLKSNSDIDGLTVFIIQRMFKNPNLKSKHTKSNAPNMLLPAYMEAIKKFTLKKFFMLVFFLDQAKQKKLISHDPCLFCRNALCKESREVIIKFTRELIAGIGDITRHLRPLGYVVSHKQSYLDEYKYAVHNIAVDIRDGVRLTKVMEIIMIKNSLLNQLRTPAISRLQKIHNVQVALNALKEANFVLVGEITANDIADGHREKTLSLLWQIIHVFRAPLFDRAANVIQMWWRKKYEVIIAKRMEEERIRQHRDYAASVIQCWWRRIQYNRLVELQMQQITSATTVIQKYCRMWLCKSRLRKIKNSILKIEKWYSCIKLIRIAKQHLLELKSIREQRRQNAAIKIQTYVRRWICIRRYDMMIRRIVLIQSVIRGYLIRKYYIELKKTVAFIENKYKGKLEMKNEMSKLAEKRKSVLVIQSYYRMIIQKRLYKKLKQSVRTIELRYIALLKMRRDRMEYLQLRKSVLFLQSLYRAKKQCIRYNYIKQCIVNMQRRFRANILMKKEKQKYLETKNAAVVLQSRLKAYFEMKKQRQVFIQQRNAVIKIQTYFRSYLITKSLRMRFIQIKNASLTIQQKYRAIVAMRKERKRYLELKNAVSVIEERYKALLLMRNNRQTYLKLKETCVLIQNRYRANICMRKCRSDYTTKKSACIVLQTRFRSWNAAKRQRKEYLIIRKAILIIQEWYRRTIYTKKIKSDFETTKNACVSIQRIYRAYMIGKKQRTEYMRIKTSTVRIQKYYRLYVEMKKVRSEFVQLKMATVVIQRQYRSYVNGKKQRDCYLAMRNAAIKIQRQFKLYRETCVIRQRYCNLRRSAIFIQRLYISLLQMRKERKKYTQLKNATVIIQQRYRAQLEMRKQKNSFNKIYSATLLIQRWYRACKLMKDQKQKYLKVLKAVRVIQKRYKAYLLGKQKRISYLKLVAASKVLQQRYRAKVLMRKQRQQFVNIKNACIKIQELYRAKKAMITCRIYYLNVLKACSVIQVRYRAHVLSKIQREKYLQIRKAAVTLQRRYRLIKLGRIERKRYLEIKKSILFIQRQFRCNKISRETRRNEAARKIQLWYKSVLLQKECRRKYIRIRNSIIIVQSAYRMFIQRKIYKSIKRSVLTIQRYYRSYKLAKKQRENYLFVQSSVIKIQSVVRCYLARKYYLKLKHSCIIVQKIYRQKLLELNEKKQKEKASVCIQKYVRRYLARSHYETYRKHVVFVQKMWRSKLITRLIRFEYLQKRKFVIKLQACVRGYLVRKTVQKQLEKLEAAKEMRRLNHAATKIQALFRGNHVRTQITSDRRVADLRRRWREGALQSTQESMRERNEEAMEVLSNMYDIETVIRAFRSLELLTEVFPMLYNDDAASVVRRVYIYMSVTNRSISSIEVLKSASSVLVNLTRYRVTGPKIYARDRIAPVLKFMWRFSNSETQLFCILCTYLWLFAKYENVKEDLKEYLHIPENHKMLLTIKGNVDRMKRMAGNASRHKFSTPQPSKFISHFLNHSVRENQSGTLIPALEPDYGIKRIDRPHYFEDSSQAINCLFKTYAL